MPIERFEQLDVWREAHALTLQIYKGTRILPPDEKFGLTAQTRRAAVSISANIAEGFKRRTPKDKSHFYNMAQGSLEELRYLALLCRDLGVDVGYDGVAERSDRIGRMLTSLIRRTKAG